uniref:Synaptobrevin, longin-like domain protein n=1 Tax=Tanacetum cinerariifolium TaxID=118510 RepID=A0A6L2NBM7_TANCI|nr:hypothetical protein [Tanacetum cinerariifolium]
MVINSPCLTDKKELAIPEQKTTGKELSNSLMAGSFPKTTLPTKLIQALVDGKKVNIKESSIRRILRLDDAEGTSCLTNTEIFEGLAKMGAKTTSWNEFSSTIASAIICLATKQKFNFSRYILLSLVKNIETGIPFFMFPRFVQLIINHQLGDMTHHKEIFDTPLLTKKVFSNMKRVGNGFSREVTPLFANMLVQAPEEVGIFQADAHPIPIPTEPSTFKPRKKHKPKRKHTQESKVPPTESLAEHNLPSPSHDPLPSGKDSLKLKELMDLCINFSNKVLDLESEVIDIKFTYQARIEKLEKRVERLEDENRVLQELKSVHSAVVSDEPTMKKEKSSKQERKIADIDADVLSMMDVNDEEYDDVEEVLEVVKVAKLITEVVTTARATKVSVPRKRRCVIIQDPKETTTTATVQPMVQAKNKRKATLIEEPKPLKRQAQIELDEEMDYFKGIRYDEIRPLFKKHYNYNQNFLDEVKVPEKEVRQEKEVEVESSKRKVKSLEQETAKKQKMKQETGELKNHLQIFPNDDDNVYTDATLLASKISIVDYKIHTERNRPYFKIIRADGNYVLFISFNTMMNNFDREDLESLWKFVKERFKKTKPKNYSDDYLLYTLKIMFEKPNVKASVWKDQKSRYGLAKVKS